MRNFSQTKRIVIKLGTNVLSKDGRVDRSFLKVVAGQIAALVGQGRQVILVTSGAIGMGAEALGITKGLKEVKKRQACAAVGQGILMREYQDAFSKYKQKVGQVLLTNAIMGRRKNFVNLKNTMEALLGMGVVPIVNENDCVSIEEIDLAFGDNDRLSALVASKIDAELLIILTDVDGLYDTNPKKDKKAKLISVVYELTDEIEAVAGGAGSAFATGGMASKIKAIRLASRGGCKVILANGRRENVISEIVNGKEIGTLFLPSRRLSNRKRWILTCPAKGVIHIDAGASKALGDGRSLLMVGITDVEGLFGANDVVQLGTGAKGISRFSAAEIRERLKTKGESKKQGKKENIIVHANDLVSIT